MSESLAGKTPGGTDATFKWLAHFGADGAFPADGATPQILYKGDGTPTPLSMTATQVFLNGLAAGLAPLLRTEIPYNRANAPLLITVEGGGDLTSDGVNVVPLPPDVLPLVSAGVWQLGEYVATEGANFYADGPSWTVDSGTFAGGDAVLVPDGTATGTPIATPQITAGAPGQGCIVDDGVNPPMYFLNMRLTAGDPVWVEFPSMDAVNAALSALLAALLAADNDWTGLQVFAGGFTVNGAAIFGPSATFTYIGSEAAHLTALAGGSASTGTGGLVRAISPTLASPIITGNLTVDTNTLFVDGTNNLVGVGTASPTSQFTVLGYSKITASGTTTPAFAGTYERAGTYNGYNYWEIVGGGKFIWYDRGYWFFSTILGTETAGFYQVFVNNGSTSLPTTASWQGHNGATGAIGTTITPIVNFTGAGSIGFNSGIVRFDSGVGFGKSPNNYPLEVLGTIGVAGSAAAGTSEQLLIYTDSSPRSYITAGAGNFGLTISSNFTGGNIVFNVAGSERMRIDNTGNVAIGGSLTVGGGTAFAKLRHGNATLVAGTVTVTDTAITANSRIQVNRFTDGGTLGDSYSVTRSAGASFTISSYTANAAQTSDTSVVTYLIIEP